MHPSRSCRSFMVTASTKGSTLSHGEHPSATLVRRGVEAFRRGDAAWIRQHVVDDIIWHVGGSTPLSGIYRGKDEVLDFMSREREGMAAVNAEMVRRPGERRPRRPAGHHVRRPT